MLRYLFAIIILITSQVAFGDFKPSPKFNEAFLSAKVVTYSDQTKQIEAIGDVILISDDYKITADKVTYDADKDELFASGRVSISDKSQRITIGESVHLSNRFNQGFINHFIVYLGDNAIIAAQAAQRIDKNHGKLINARYTPCKVCSGKNPMWQVSAQSTELDLEKEKITYRNARFEIYGKPIFFTPYFSHPTPNAKAQSGVLLPAIKNSRLGVPIYYRPSSDLDFTFTPRMPLPKIGERKKSIYNGMIYESEMRYITQNGYQALNTSFTKSKDEKGRKQYYLSYDNVFTNNNYNYNVSLNRVSNKAYLKNYYQKYDPYLISKAEVSAGENRNFILAETAYFQGLRPEDRVANDPIALPDVYVKKVIPLKDYSTYFTVENNTLGYGQDKGLRMGRTALQFKLTQLCNTDNGHLFKIEGYNRADLYYLRNSTHYNEKSKKLSRNTPELRTEWRYPLFKSNENGSLILLEPQALVVLGAGNFKKNHKYAAVDVGIYDLSEENLFIANRFGGIDYHEYGTRMSYGLSSTMEMGNGNALKGFIGKLNYLNKNTYYYGADIVGKVSYNMNDTIEPYYNFKRKRLTLRAYHDDIGIKYNIKNIVYGHSGLIDMKEIKYFEYTSQRLIIRPKVRQSYTSLNYNINDNWSAGIELRVDILAHKKTSPIYRNMRVTYLGDCVSMTAQFGNNYTYDEVRGIHKKRTNSVGLGLKTLM